MVSSPPSWLLLTGFPAWFSVLGAEEITVEIISTEPFYFAGTGVNDDVLTTSKHV